MRLKPKSLEQWITLGLLIVNSIILLLVILLLRQWQASGLESITLLSLLLPLQFFISEKIKSRLVSPYYRLLALIDSIKADYYSLHARASFEQGIVNDLFSELSAFSDSLRSKRQQYDKKNLLVHSLIQQLDSPVLLIDQSHKLILGNPALSAWLAKDWRLSRLMPITSLHFVLQNHQWHFNNDELALRYKIRSSQFSDLDGEHQLLILTDISQELRQMQQQSWQNVVRVLTHEIKNSLTPIKSLAQSLAQFSSSREQKEALDVIVERSQSLSEFVSHYAKLTQKRQLNPQAVNLPELISSICPLYEPLPIELKFSQTLKHQSVNLDPVLFKQVLINLIENAIQAGQNTATALAISITATIIDNRLEVRIIDNGPGIKNTQNLFVPFYTTKADGQGIGLVLSRHLIEQHQGQLTLTNNATTQQAELAGATALIRLPINSD